MKLLALTSCLILQASCVSIADEADAPAPGFPGGKSDDTSRSALWSLFEWNYELTPQDRHDKYCKMAVSPFTFYRGSNHLFWQDLSGDVRLDEFGSPNTRTWLQGDLHAYNFGSFENGSGDVVYALNDFDESLVADYQFDLWRMAASMVLLAEEGGDLNQGEVEDFIDSFTESYLDAMSDYRGNPRERSLDFDKDESYEPLAGFLDDVEDDNNREDALASWTHKVNGERRFNQSKEKLGLVSASERSAIEDALGGYQATLVAPSDFSADYFEVKDVARRLLAGTGSLGTPRFYALIEGPSTDDDDDRILDVKEQKAPTPWWYLPYEDRVAYSQSFDNHASRHASAMSALVGDPDPLQGWLVLASAAYSVRERSIYKESFPTDQLRQTDDYQSMAEQWGIVLATAHARSDRDFDEVLIPHSVDREIDLLTEGAHDAFRDLVRELAFEYAQQTNDDYTLFMDWLAPADCPAP